MPLLARDGSGDTAGGRRSLVMGYLVPTLAAALVVTLVTLAVTHHSSKSSSNASGNKNELLLSHDPMDNRAVLTGMTHPAVARAGAEEHTQESAELARDRERAAVGADEASSDDLTNELTVLAEENRKAGPGRCCSPRHRVPHNSRKDR